MAYLHKEFRPTQQEQNTNGNSNIQLSKQISITHKAQIANSSATKQQSAMPKTDLSRSQNKPTGKGSLDCFCVSYNAPECYECSHAMSENTNSEPHVHSVTHENKNAASEVTQPFCHDDYKLDYDNAEQTDSVSLVSHRKPSLVDEDALTDSQELMPPPLTCDSFMDCCDNISTNCISISRSRDRQREMFLPRKRRSSSRSTVILSDDECETEKERSNQYFQRSPSKILKRDGNMLSVDSLDSNCSTVLLSPSSSEESLNQKSVATESNETEIGISNSLSGSNSDLHVIKDCFHSCNLKYAEHAVCTYSVNNVNMCYCCSKHSNINDDNNSKPADITKDDSINDVKQIYNQCTCSLVYETEAETSNSFCSLVAHHEPKLVDEDMLTDSQELMPPPFIFDHNSHQDHHNNNLCSRSRARQRKEYSQCKRKRRSSSRSTVILSDEESEYAKERRNQYFLRSSSKILKRDDNIMFSVDSVDSDCSTVLISSSSSIDPESVSL